MKYFFLIYILSSIYLLAASEPSALGAGEFDSNNPYGLTDKEKLVIKNQKNVDNLKKNLKELKNKDYLVNQKITQLEEKLVGLQTVLEGLNGSVTNQKHNGLQFSTQLSTQSKEFSTRLDGIETQIDNIEKKLNEYNSTFENISNEYNQSFVKFKDIFTQLSDLISKINQDYVSKAEFEAFKNLILDEFQKINQGDIKDYLRSKTNFEIYKEAEELFEKKLYSKVIPYYIYLIDHNFKPATHNYYLAESYYYTKQYKSAVAHYTQSYKLYPKGDWIPNLLLHSGISLQNIGDFVKAKNFYETLISNFSNSKEANEAKELLKKLN